MLRLPEVISDVGSNITMHQLLRLMYIDQRSPTDSLLRHEQFDTPLTRRTIEDLLYGVYDDSIYEKEQSLVKAQKVLGKLDSNYQALVAMADNSFGCADVEKLKQNIAEGRTAIELADTNIAELLAAPIKDMAARENTSIVKLVKELKAAKSELANRTEQLQALEFDQADALQYVASLEERMHALDESIATSTQLSHAVFSNCPACHAVLARADDAACCRLCGSEDTGSRSTSPSLARTRQDMMNQLRESQQLQDHRDTLIGEHKNALSLLRREAKRMQRHFDTEYSTIRSSRDSAIDKVWENRGVLEATLQFEEQQLRSLEFLAKSREEVAKLRAETAGLRLAIKTQRRSKEQRLEQARGAVDEMARYFIRHDVTTSGEPVEAAFSNASEVIVDFARNSFAVDERNQFSASSTVVLKNAALLGVLFAALFDDGFRYPLFVMCDNIEDKGMTPERSHNMQRLIAEKSEEAEVEHQIIITTSMLAPELDTERYLVGHELTTERKSLDFSGRSDSQPA
jgi:hypothetical protein